MNSIGFYMMKLKNKCKVLKKKKKNIKNKKNK